MSLIILLIALCFAQNVISVSERHFLHANSTNILFNRDTDPTYAIDASCSRFPQVLDVVNDWVEIAQVTARRLNLGNADPHFQWAYKILFASNIGSTRLFTFPQFEEQMTAFEFVSCE